MAGITYGLCTEGVVADDETSFFRSRASFLLINDLGNHVTSIQTNTGIVRVSRSITNFNCFTTLYTTEYYYHGFPIHQHSEVFIDFNQ